MGTVWVADHLALDCEVAVKFIYADLVRRDASMTERFKREASLTAKIRSPHVVQTFDFGVMTDGTPFIVMELLVGESLGARLEREGQIPVDDAIRIMKQTARALRHAHKLGIVHRDIKPDNLFLVTNEVQGHTDYPPDDDDDVEDDALFVKILDFGIAKEVRSVNMTSTGATFGTPPFMSPEQLLSTKDVDEHADIWALAGVAFMMLTGQPPFPGETLAAISMAVCNSQYIPPRSLRMDLPSALDGWFARAFNRDKDDRFSTVTRLARTFARAARGHDIAPADRSSEFTDRSSAEYYGEHGSTYDMDERPSDLDLSSGASAQASADASGSYDAGASGQYPATLALDSGAGLRPSVPEHAAGQVAAATAGPPITGSDLAASAQAGAAHTGASQQAAMPSTFSPALSTLSPAGVPKSGSRGVALAVASVALLGLLGVAGAAFFAMRGGDETSAAAPLSVPPQASEEGVAEAPPPPPEPEASAGASASAAASASAKGAEAPKPPPPVPVAPPITQPPPAVAPPPVVAPPKPPPKPPSKPKANCNPPYQIKNGVKVWKPQCL